jgi:hypothetical protein
MQRIPFDRGHRRRETQEVAWNQVYSQGEPKALENRERRNSDPFQGGCYIE